MIRQELQVALQKPYQRADWLTLLRAVLPGTEIFGTAQPIEIDHKVARQVAQLGRARLNGGLTILPGILRRRKTTWHQAVAALGLMIFLLSIPALFGVHTRSRIGFVLQPDTPLRLTPTREAQPLTRLAAGEPARWVRARGDYVLVRTSRALGWVEQDQLGLTCPTTGRRAG